MKEKKLETRQEILDYLKLEQEKIMVEMQENLKERQTVNHTIDENVKLAREFELLLARNNAFRDMQYKILGIED